MKLKPVMCLLAVAMLVPSNLHGQESVCHLFSHLAPQTNERQLVLTGNLVMSKDIAVLGAWDCEKEYISDHMVRPIAVLLRPSGAKCQHRNDSRL